MDRRKRNSVVAAFAIALLVYALTPHLWARNNKTSIILGFHPTDFPAQAARAFFYSIGDRLMYSSTIDSNASVLLRGKFYEFQVSPDGTNIAVVVDHKLEIVQSTPARVLSITPVDSIDRRFKPIGRAFFRDRDFQWSADGKYLYLIKDEYYQSGGLQLFSIHGELWRYCMDTGSLEPILKPFPAYNYFFGTRSGIYFSIPMANGELQLEYFDGSHTKEVGGPKSSLIPSDKLAPDFIERPFHSFQDVNYADTELPAKGALLFTPKGTGIDILRIRGREILQVTQGQGWDEYYHFEDMQWSRFLPGDRFLLLSVPYCGNYRGQLLVDAETGQYRILPKDTRVYPVFNTETHPHYRIGNDGIEPEHPSSGKN
jgi:hypothetical protein